jgi:hypothetical protein
MKKLITVLCITCCIYGSYGQVNSISGSGNNTNRVVKYSVIRDAPEYANNLNIVLLTPYFHYSSYGENLGLGANICYNFKNIATLNLLFKKGLVNFPLKDPEPGLNDITPAGNKSKMTHIDFTLDCSFAKYISDKKKMIWNGEINFKQMFRFAIRAGYQYISNLYVIDDYEIRGYNISDPAKTEINLYHDGANQLMCTNHIVSLGFSAKRTSNFVIQIEDKNGKNSFQRLDEAYVDILFSPSIKLKDVNRIDSLYNSPQNAELVNTYHINSGKKLNWGFRAGYTHYPLSLAGFFYGLEAGIQPGPTAGIGKNGYILAKIGVSFSANLFNRP